MAQSNTLDLPASVATVILLPHGCLSKCIFVLEVCILLRLLFGPE